MKTHYVMDAELETIKAELEQLAERCIGYIVVREVGSIVRYCNIMLDAAKSAAARGRLDEEKECVNAISKIAGALQEVKTKAKQ